MLLSVLIVTASLALTYGFHEPCTDFEGHQVSHGEIYIPGPNKCSNCACNHGSPMWCQTIFCLEPPFRWCDNYTAGYYCCEFHCHDVNATQKYTTWLNKRLAKLRKSGSVNVQPLHVYILTLIAVILKLML